MCIYNGRGSTSDLDKTRSRMNVAKCDVRISYTHLDPLLTQCPCWPASTAKQSGMVTLTLDLLTLKMVSQSRVTWATSVPILVFLFST